MFKPENDKEYVRLRKAEADAYSEYQGKSKRLKELDERMPKMGYTNLARIYLTPARDKLEEEVKATSKN